MLEESCAWLCYDRAQSTAAELDMTNGVAFAEGLWCLASCFAQKWIHKGNHTCSMGRRASAPPSSASVMLWLSILSRLCGR